jgi:hypothetical protein
MVLCPAGNGVDTHRLWEVLYLKRIPITIKVGDYKIYKLYEKLPIIILENESDLYDKVLLTKKLYEIKSKPYDINLLNINYWLKKISEHKI